MVQDVKVCVVLLEDETAEKFFLRRAGKRDLVSFVFSIDSAYRSDLLRWVVS